MNTNFKINIGAAPKQGGINKHALKQSQSPEVVEKYEDVFNQTEGSLTTVIDNDTVQKVNVAIATLQPNEIQQAILSEIEKAFKFVENHIEPERLQFSISKAIDDEICINRFSQNGIGKIIINDDGVVVFTFIAYKNSNKADIFTPFEQGVNDYELLAYNFFAL